MPIEIPRGPWVMPDWMKPYAGFFNNTGHPPTSEVIERWHNLDTSKSHWTDTMVVACIHSQVTLLERLHEAGKI